MRNSVSALDVGATVVELVVELAGGSTSVIEVTASVDVAAGVVVVGPVGSGGTGSFAAPPHAPAIRTTTTDRTACFNPDIPDLPCFPGAMSHRWLPALDRVPLVAVNESMAQSPHRRPHNPQTDRGGGVRSYALVRRVGGRFVRLDPPSPVRTMRTT